MPKAKNLISRRKELRKLSMQKQRYYYNYFLAYGRLMPTVFKDIDQQNKKIKTLKKISLLISYLLTHLIKHNNLLSIRLTKKTRTTKKVFGTMVDKNKVKTKTLF